MNILQSIKRKIAQSLDEDDVLKTPQMIVYLAPDGRIRGQLPGANGARRVVDFDSLESLKRILQTEEKLIGQDGAPTQQQIDHWEKCKRPKSKKGWQSKLSSSCPFCRAEAIEVLAEMELAEADSTVIRRFDRKGKPMSFDDF